MTAMAKGTGRGGRREGAGRPRGAKNKRSTKLIERAKTKGLELPLPRLLRRMNDLELPEKYRDHLAALAAPYCHARLSAVAEMKRPSQMTDEELDRAIAMAEEDLLRQGIGRDKWRAIH